MSIACAGSVRVAITSSGPDALALRDDVFDLSFAAGYRQLTDIYLQGIAVRMNGCLPTFDRTIPRKAARSATAAALAVVAAA